MECLAERLKSGRKVAIAADYRVPFKLMARLFTFLKEPDPLTREYA